MELLLANVDRARKIFNKYVEVFTENSSAWIAFANQEAELGELERAR